ncbi:hypothetical protein CYJ16_04495 [Actinotignum timonense]|nr:hypothetical protein CYJ16_04495 [Actinotignum timonense]
MLQLVEYALVGLELIVALLSVIFAVMSLMGHSDMIYLAMLCLGIYAVASVITKGIEHLGKNK